MPAQFFHGLRVAEAAAMRRGLAPVATAIIGLVATAPDATPGAFPLDRPVLVTDIRAAMAAAGEAGTLGPALAAIADQATPVLIVVRVPADADPDVQAATVIGDVTDGQATGIQALLDSESQLGLRPRILGAPGLDVPAVRTALGAVAVKLRGFVYARAFGDTAAEAIVDRQTVASRETMLIWPETNAGVPGDAVARAMGLRARIDEDTGWHKTLSNVPVAGVQGLDRLVYFDLADPSTTAGVLNAAGITTLVRIAGAHRFWGNRTCAEDQTFAFESRVRTSQALQDAMLGGLAWAVDKPLTAQLVRDLSEEINAEFRRLKARQMIIGGEVLPLDPTLNTATELAAGRLALDYEFTDVAPAEGVTLTQSVTDRFYVDFAAQVAAA